MNITLTEKKSTSVVFVNSDPVNKTGVKPSGRDRVRIIAHMVDEGHTSREIAEKLGINRQRVCRIAERAGIPIGKRGGTGRIGAYIPRSLKMSVRRQAEAKGVSVSAYIATVLGAVCSDDTVARKTLGRQALPVRLYRAKTGGAP